MTSRARLLQPFWPMGTGCARGFMGVLDTAWLVRAWASGRCTPLDAMAERESVYQLLSQTTPDNTLKNFALYTIDPSTRYAPRPRSYPPLPPSPPPKKTQKNHSYRLMLTRTHSHRLTQTHSTHTDSSRLILSTRRLSLTHTDSCRLTLTHADSPTHADSHRLMPTRSDSRSLMLTRADSRRLAPTHADSRCGRYVNVNPHTLKPFQMKHQYDGQDGEYLSRIVEISEKNSKRYGQCLSPPSGGAHSDVAGVGVGLGWGVLTAIGGGEWRR